MKFLINFYDAMIESLFYNVLKRRGYGKLSVSNESAEKTSKDKIYIFKSKDFTTVMIGRHDKINDVFYVQRGDGTTYPYSKCRIDWFREIKI